MASNDLSEQDAAALKRIGENLRAARLNDDGTIRVTQDKLAAGAGLSRTMPGLVENAHKDARVLTLIRLARALDVPPAVLLDGVE